MQYFFEIYNKLTGDGIEYKHKELSNDLRDALIEIYIDKFDNIYGIDIKENLNEEFHDLFLDLLDDKQQLNPDIGIRLTTKLDYRIVDESYDNVCRFVEEMTNEQEKIDKMTDITCDILDNAEFSLLEHETNTLKDYEKQIYGIEDYRVYRKWVDDDSNIVLKIDIDNGSNNRGSKWHVHIDNSDCETIGAADISTVYEFNLLMKVFGSKFRLYSNDDFLISD